MKISIDDQEMLMEQYHILERCHKFLVGTEADDLTLEDLRRISGLANAAIMHILMVLLDDAVLKKGKSGKS